MIEYGCEEIRIFKIIVLQIDIEPSHVDEKMLQGPNKDKNMETFLTESFLHLRNY